MDSEPLSDVERPAFGGATDAEMTDFRVGANPRRPPGVAAVYDSALSASRLHPADDYVDYRSAAADHLGCEPAQVVPASGEFAALRRVCSRVLSPGDTAAVQVPACEEFAREVRIQNAEPVEVAHDDLLDVDPADHAAVLALHPNTRRGPPYETDALREFVDRCRAAGIPFVVDETFLALSDRPTLAGVDGVVVVRSLGEAYGLPGLRMGLVVATGRLREELVTTRPCWEVSAPAAMVGEYCLQQESFLAESRERVAEERERLVERLQTAFEVETAVGVAICVDVGDRDPAALAADAREAGLVVGYGDELQEMDNHIAFGLRSRQKNEKLLDALGV